MSDSQTAVAEKRKSRSGSNTRKKGHNLSWRMTENERLNLDTVASSLGFGNTQDWLRSLTAPALEQAAEQGLIERRAS
ncbi:hypothetical protein [Mycolicibacterium llatzerense]|uniref:hypothetical protein n=1 Tax=Mycolicibacterium llatzerense TaxID=280871 RepID=UPI0021B621AF|nr:hypothetical protein [Mycolicibacterium llatzerense]MCT7372997.1 hypothetical protein [Mycolicibacterium llatzerense]